MMNRETMRLMNNALNEARLVVCTRDLVAVWHGGSMVNIYDPADDWRNVDVFTFGSRPETAEEARDRILGWFDTVEAAEGLGWTAVRLIL